LIDDTSCICPSRKVRASRGITHHVDMMTHGWHHPTATDRGIDRIVLLAPLAHFRACKERISLGQWRGCLGAALVVFHSVASSSAAGLASSLIGSRNYSTKKYQVAQARCTIDTWRIGRFSTHTFHTICQTIYCA
jgi:hypothetical protein